MYLGAHFESFVCFGGFSTETHHLSWRIYGKETHILNDGVTKGGTASN